MTARAEINSEVLVCFGYDAEWAVVRPLKRTLCCIVTDENEFRVLERKGNVVWTISMARGRGRAERSNVAAEASKEICIVAIALSGDDEISGHSDCGTVYEFCDGRLQVVFGRCAETEQDPGELVKPV